MKTSIDQRPLLNLLTWLSPGFPTGGYAHSQGLEWAVEAGDITDGANLRDWLTDVLAHGSGRSDAILLRHAHRVAADPAKLAKIVAFASACAPTRERHDEALNQGRAFRLAVTAWTCAAVPEDAPYAVAVGAAAGGCCIPEDDTVVAFLQAFATNLISAAVRLVPLGQTVGLHTLAALEPTILAIAEQSKNAALDDVGGCAFRADIATMRHETQYTRLFRS